MTSWVHIAVVAGLISASAPFGGQSGAPQPPSRAETIAAARTIAGQARYASFITLDRT